MWATAMECYRCWLIPTGTCCSIYCRSSATNAYTDELKKYGIRISMTEDYKPTDNAMAERVNGILKTEVVYRERRFKTYGDALERISGFILFYNDTRPHYSIGMKTQVSNCISSSTEHR